MNDRALDRLFRRFRDRHDGAALAAVFDATSRELFDVACHLIRDPVEAEDLVQATFLTAIRKAGEYDGASPVKGWLYGILWREGAKARRAAARTLDPRRLAERREPEPIEGLVALEFPAAVARALAELPARYREVLDPLLREGRPPEEIAAALDRSPGTIRSQIHRGLERLRRALPGDFVPVPGLAAISVRGLSKVRGEILQAAGFSPAVAAGAPALAMSAGIGGLVMTKGALLAGTATLALVAAGWFAYDGSKTAEKRLPDAPEAAAERPEAASPRRPEEEEALANGHSASARAEVRGAASANTPDATLEVAHWLARFGEAPDDWRHGWAVAEEIAKLPPDRALAVMTAVWPKLSVPVREQALKPFVFHGGHPGALKLLDLAATDPSLSVQGRAFTYLAGYAFQDFTNDYEGYLRWAKVYRDMPIADALTRNAREFATELRALPLAELAQRIRALDRLDLEAGERAGVDLAAVMRDAGGLQALSACLGGEDAEAKRRALTWSKTMQADEPWLRAWVLPAIEAGEGAESGVLDASFDALARPDCRWAEPSILEHLRRASEREENAAGGSEETAALPATKSAAGALAEIGDPAAIPAMIEILAHDRSGRLGYDVGYFGLAKLTGVRWQESYGAAWWLDWWEKNKGRMPPEVRDVAIRR